MFRYSAVYENFDNTGMLQYKIKTGITLLQKTDR